MAALLPFPAIAAPFKVRSSNLSSLPPLPISLSPTLHLRRRRCGPPAVSVRASSAAVVANVSGGGGFDRFRLDNLGPQPGAKKKGKRKGRGHAAGQGGSCGFGMRGQKSRSGPGVRKGFEGGQMPLYRRIPKLRGIAGGGFLEF